LRRYFLFPLKAYRRRHPHLLSAPFCLQKKYSQDTITRKNGGDLGFLTKGYMPEKVEKIAFSLKAGQVSGVIDMPYGCHVIKAFQVDPGGLISFDKVKADIVAWIKDDMKAEFSAKYRDQHMSNAKIKWGTKSGKRPKPMKIKKARSN
jgi:parvulin-like peptidyl-prolyl isomerase